MLFKILIADTSGTDHSTIAAMPVWGECGFEITGQTAELTAAVNAALKQECDLILCIDRQPEAPAPELLRRLARKRRNIPVLVISRSDDSRAMRACFLLGAVDYLTEPFTEEDVRESLGRAAEALGKNVMRVEYLMALEHSLAMLPYTDDSAPLLRKLREFLLEVQGVTATTETAADFFGLNRDYFARYFKKHLGQSFSAFYKGFLMEYAKLLLVSGHYRVHDVSRLLGFSSTDYFTKIFRNATGQTPSAYKTR